jgi:hypothetical protein
MSKSGPTGKSFTSALTGRRRTRTLRMLEAAASELLKDLRALNPYLFKQPGASIFPKKIFVTEDGSPPLPDGRSPAYLELVQAQWMEAFALAEESESADFAAATVRMLQQAVVDSHVLERRLLARLEEQS